MISTYGILRAQLEYLKDKRSKCNVSDVEFFDQWIKEVEDVINGVGSLDYTFTIERPDGTKTNISLQALEYLSIDQIDKTLN